MSFINNRLGNGFLIKFAGSSLNQEHYFGGAKKNLDVRLYFSASDLHNFDPVKSYTPVRYQSNRSMDFDRNNVSLNYAFDYNWEKIKISDDIESISIIAINQRNDHIYAGCQLDAGGESCIFRSIDSGASFQLLEKFEGSVPIHDIAFDRRNGIYICSYNAFLETNGKRGALVYSADGSSGSYHVVDGKDVGSYKTILARSNGEVIAAGYDKASSEWLVRRSVDGSSGSFITIDNVSQLTPGAYDTIAFDIVEDSSGNVYVCGNESRVRWIIRKCSDTTTLGNFSYIDSFESSLAGGDFLVRPYIMCLDSNENLYVCGYNRVYERRNYDFLETDHYSFFVRKSTTLASGSFFNVDEFKFGDAVINYEHDYDYPSPSMVCDSSDNIFYTLDAQISIGFNDIGACFIKKLLPGITQELGSEVSGSSILVAAHDFKCDVHFCCLSIDSEDRLYFYNKLDNSNCRSFFRRSVNNDKIFPFISEGENLINVDGVLQLTIEFYIDETLPTFNNLYFLNFLDNSENTNAHGINIGRLGKVEKDLNIPNKYKFKYSFDYFSKYESKLNLPLGSGCFALIFLDTIPSGMLVEKIYIDFSIPLSNDGVEYFKNIESQNTDKIMSYKKTKPKDLEELELYKKYKEFPHSMGIFQMPNLSLGTTDSGKIGKTENNIIQINHIGSVVKVLWPRQDNSEAYMRGFGDFSVGQKPGVLSTDFTPGIEEDVEDYDHITLYCYLLKVVSGTSDSIEIKIQRRPLGGVGHTIDQAISYDSSGSETVAELKDLVYKKTVDYSDLSIKEIGFPIDIPLTNLKSIRILAKQTTGQSDVSNRNLIIWGRFIKSEEET